MSPTERAQYFGTIWPAACATQRWNPKDETQRRAITRDCMRAVRGPETESTTDLGRDEVTALFTLLTYLAKPDAVTSARWLDCQQDYVAFNRARQADWHERETYGARKNKLDRDRFAGEASAQGDPFATFDPAAARKRHVTMASRHRAKKRRAAAQPRPGDPF